MSRKFTRIWLSAMLNPSYTKRREPKLVVAGVGSVAGEPEVVPGHPHVLGGAVALDADLQRLQGLLGRVRLAAALFVGAGGDALEQAGRQVKPIGVSRRHGRRRHLLVA